MPLEQMLLEQMTLEQMSLEQMSLEQTSLEQNLLELNSTEQMLMSWEQKLSRQIGCMTLKTCSYPTHLCSTLILAKVEVFVASLLTNFKMFDKKQQEK